MTIQKWGALASCLLAVVLVLSELIYLVGNLREAHGPLVYALADLLYGPVRAACLATAAYALRERVGEGAPRRMSLVLLATALSAGMFVTAALLRSSNRHYHLSHPELHLETSQTVLIVWTTLLGGVIATGWHFLGWSQLLLGSAGWTTGRLPRALCALYWLAGAQSLFAYLLPANRDMDVVVWGVVTSIWQGIVLWKTELGETPAPEANANQPDLA